jgi:small subunit ribosomal protein S19
MSRGKWKAPYVQNSLINKFFKEESAPQNEIKTISRQSVIIPKFIGYTIQIHNGKIFSKLKITEDMVGHKLGEFSPTRKRFSFKKKNKNK